MIRMLKCKLGHVLPGRVVGLRFAVVAAVAYGLAGLARAQSESYRGLWVGQATLNRVAEVPVPLDQNNNPIAPDPKVATPTADNAELRLILHVNGAGQVSLLRDVAVLKRTTGTNTTMGSELDMALVSDERLYGQFPPQPAVRLASAAFDFGDSRATEVLNAMVEAMVVTVEASVSAAPNFQTEAGRLAAQNAAAALAQAQASTMAGADDVATAYQNFLANELPAAVITAIAESVDPAVTAQSHLVAATNLMNASFYRDTRGIEAIHAVLAAIAAAGTNTPARVAAAHNAISTFADVADEYHRFINGELFGDMLEAAAQAAANAAVLPAATPATIRTAVNANSAVYETRAEAIRLKVTAYQDQRPTNAVERVIEAVIQAAASNTNEAASVVRDAAFAAGLAAQMSVVPRFAVSVQNPTLDYNSYVTSAAYLGAAATGAAAAADGAVSERHNNALWTPASVRSAARVEAVTALRDAYRLAAQCVRTELPLSGVFGPGQGDARFTWEISRTNAPALGAAALTGVLYLPAQHPTNPFRHRRHPDHTVGRDVTRQIRLDFSGSPTNGLESAGFGVQRITGVYREEIGGLHKPLGGPGENLGLKVEGGFELNRISLIDALNAL